MTRTPRCPSQDPESGRKGQWQPGKKRGRAFQAEGVVCAKAYGRASSDGSGRKAQRAKGEGREKAWGAG